MNKEGFKTQLSLQFFNYDWKNSYSGSRTSSNHPMVRGLSLPLPLSLEKHGLNVTNRFQILLMILGKLNHEKARANNSSFYTFVADFAGHHWDGVAIYKAPEVNLQQKSLLWYTNFIYEHLGKVKTIKNP